VTDTDRHNENWVRNTFGTSYIEPMGRLKANIELNAAYGSARETWWLRGRDDEDNSFEFQGSIELISLAFTTFSSEGLKKIASFFVGSDTW
jgi:hypothetical protein